MSKAQYYIGIVVSFSGTLFTEIGAISCLALTISPNLKMGFVNAGVIFVLVDVWATLLGSNLVILLKGIDGVKALPFYINILSLSIFSVVLGVILLQYHRFQRYKNIKILTEIIQHRTKEVVE
jgi:hypothetical protein